MSVKSSSLFLPVIPESVPFTVLPENTELEDGISSLDRPSHTSLLETLTDNMLAGTLYCATANVIAFLTIPVVSHSLCVVGEIGDVVIYLFCNTIIARLGWIIQAIAASRSKRNCWILFVPSSQRHARYHCWEMENSKAWN